MRRAAARLLPTVAQEAFRIRAVVQLIAQCTAKSNRRERALLSPAAHRQKPARRLRRAFRRDIDDPVHRVRAPERRAGTADDFDALDVFHHHILRIPKNAGKKRCVHRPPIDQHEEFIGKNIVEAARAHRRSVRVHLRHIQARRETQRLENTARTRAADLLLRDNVNRRG